MIRAILAVGFLPALTVNLVAVLLLVSVSAAVAQNLPCGIRELKRASDHPLVHAAVTGEHTQTIERLLDDGADVNARDSCGHTALMGAALVGHYATVKLLLERGADVCAVSRNGTDTLMYAVLGGNPYVVEKLLEAGAGDKAANDLKTHLLIAARRGSEDIVRLLVKAGADVNVVDAQCGWSALTIAVRNGNEEMVRELLKEGADANQRDKNGWTPLLFAAEKGDAEIVKALLDHGADYSVRDRDGWTPLIWASQRDHLDVVRALIERGADVRKPAWNGWTPLLGAAGYARPELVEYLIQQGAAIDVKDRRGRTPLLFASEKGRSAAIEVLLKHGADIRAKNKRGLTPLLLAAENGNAGSLNVLMEYGVNADESDDFGWTALMSAAGGGQTEVVELLIDQGASTNAMDNYGWTALMGAAMNGHAETVKRLIQYGSDVNAADRHGGRTALMRAIRQGHRDVAKMLLDGGADVNAVSDNGRTALIMAVEADDRDSVTLLLERGADVNIEDSTGNTALSVAKKKYHETIASLLREHEAYEESPLPPRESFERASKRLGQGLSGLSVKDVLDADRARELKSELDTLLSSGNDTDIRKRIHDIFALIDHMAASGEHGDLEYYLEKALKHDAWALKYQMLYAEVSEAEGRRCEAKQTARTVEKHAETDELVNRARLLLNQEPLKSPEDITPLSPRAPTVVLIPIGDVDACVLESLAQAIPRHLHMRAEMMDAHVQVPPCTRDPDRLFMRDLRSRLKLGLSKNLPIRAFVRANGLTPEDLRHNSVVLDVWRLYAESKGGSQALARFEEKLRVLKEADSQWDAEELLQILQAAVRPFQHDRVYFLAITRLDTFAKGANYVFGLSKTNDHYAVMSYRRFTADFWKAAPNRERLLERAVKQAMSSVGFMLGVPRCTSPTCARAFPNSLAEHDAKSLNLCPACSNGFARALFNNRL